MLTEKGLGGTCGRGRGACHLSRGIEPRLTTRLRKYPRKAGCGVLGIAKRAMRQSRVIFLTVKEFAHSTSQITCFYEVPEFLHFFPRAAFHPDVVKDR